MGKSASAVRDRFLQWTLKRLAFRSDHRFPVTISITFSDETLDKFGHVLRRSWNRPFPSLPRTKPTDPRLFLSLWLEQRFTQRTRSVSKIPSRRWDAEGVFHHQSVFFIYWGGDSAILGHQPWRLPCSNQRYWEFSNCPISRLLSSAAPTHLTPCTRMNK